MTSKKRQKITAGVSKGVARTIIVERASFSLSRILHSVPSRGDKPKTELENYEPDATKNIYERHFLVTIIEPMCTRRIERQSRPTAGTNDHVSIYYVPLAVDTSRGP
ncbi:hypothetical protein ANTPLA_LOCUS10715 [Anthophora plagiata]